MHILLPILITYVYSFWTILNLYHRDGEKIDLYTYAQCDETGCRCKLSAENHRDRKTTCHPYPITLQLHAGYYHDCYKGLLKVCQENKWINSWCIQNPTNFSHEICFDLQDSFPHIVIAPNAGIAAYPSWVPTLVSLSITRVCGLYLKISLLILKMLIWHRK